MKHFRPYLLAIVFCCFFQSAFSQVGINTTSPLSMLDINGNFSVKTITLTGSSSATLISDGVYISVNPQDIDQEFQLPSAVTYPGRIYIIRNIQNAITAKLTSAGGMFFLKSSNIGSAQIYMYENNSKSIIVVSDGANWTYFN